MAAATPGFTFPQLQVLRRKCPTHGLLHFIGAYPLSFWLACLWLFSFYK